MTRTLPAAPAGFRLSAPAAQIRVTDSGGSALGAFAFARPVSLSLRFEAGAGPETGFASLDVGYLGEASTDWAVLETERDPATALATAHPRWTGVYALLVRLPTPSESKPAGSAGLPAMLLPALGLTVVLLVIAAALLIWRRRR